MYDEDDPFDPSELTALVVDHNHYHRGIAIDQLRAMGFRRAIGASDSHEGWELLTKNNPNIILLEWLDAANDGLDFVRRVRTSEDSPNRAVSMFMLTSRGARADVERARMAGVDGYMRKPISALSLQKRVRAVVLNPQPFIVAANYAGPCRRRRNDAAFEGPWRRQNDETPAQAMAEQQNERNAERARASAAALEACVRDLATDPKAARRVFKAAQDLCDVAEEIGDPNVQFGSREMVRYLKAQGAAAQLDAEVVSTHVAALHQLVHLPHGLRDERERVAHSLKRMVDKKLRQAS